MLTGKPHYLSEMITDGPDAEALAEATRKRLVEKFKAELRQCRDHCDGKPRIDHRKAGEHSCTTTCRPHVCKPLSTATVRKNLF